MTVLKQSLKCHSDPKSDTPPASHSSLRDSPMPRLDFIQALRAIAALVVTIYHVIKEAHRQNMVGDIVYNASVSLQFGVDLFFIISGFIIVYVTQKAENGPRGAYMFILKRLLRVAPIYWIFTLLMAMAMLAAPSVMNNTHFDTIYLVASLMFTPWPSTNNDALLPVLGLGWTLNYEVFFYLLFGILITFRLRARGFTIFLVLICLWLIGAFIPKSMPQLWYWTRSLILEFGFGALIATALLSGKTRLSPRLSLAILGGGLALWQVFCWSMPNHSAFDPNFRGYTLGLAAAAVFAGLTWSPSAQAALVGEGFQRRAAVLLGDASYSLYLVHMFVVRAATVTFDMIWPGAGALIYVPITVVACVVVAVLCHRFIEKPLLEFGGRLAEPNRKARLT